MKITNHHLAIGIPCSFPSVPPSFFYSFVLMEKPDFTLIHADNGHIEDLRNNIVQSALDMGATRLLMCDTDQIYHPKTVTRLLSHNLPVVGAVVHRRYPPFDSLMMRKVKITEGPLEGIVSYVPIEDYEDNRLYEVDATGTGCNMYDMDIFRKIPYPWFECGTNPDGSPIGEDFMFCQKLQYAGYKIFVDTSIPAAHITTMAVTKATAKLYSAMKSREAQKSVEPIDQ